MIGRHPFRGVTFPCRMKALSLIQPWAWAVAHGGKRLENRKWKWLRHGIAPIRKRFPEGERIAIHASSTKPRPCDVLGVATALGFANPVDLLLEHPTCTAPGRIVATCTIDDVLRASNADERDDDGLDGWPLYSMLVEDNDRYLTDTMAMETRADQIRRWWLGPYALVLGNVLAVPEDQPPIYARGAQMFWPVPDMQFERLHALGLT